jgi:hypothetical protein
MRVWDIQFHVGEKVSNALFKILATVPVCHVVYELINAKKIRAWPLLSFSAVQTFRRKNDRRYYG